MRFFHRAWPAAIALTVSTAPLAAQHTVELSNGDRLSGRLVRVTGDAWILSYQGAEVPVPVGQVRGFAAPAPIGLRLTDGTILAGTVTTTGERLQITGTDGTTRAVAPGDLAAVGAPDALDRLRVVRVGLFTPLHRFWRATGGLGFSDKSGNSRARGLNASIELERRTPKDRLTIGLGTQREESQPPGGQFEETVNKYYGSLRADIYVIPRIFLFGETRQERDRFQDVSLRSSYNAGLGFQAVATPRTDLRFSSSGGYRRESFFSQDLAETAGILGLSSAFRQVLGPATFAWRLDWTPNVEEVADYRLRSESSLTLAAFKGLGFRVGALNEYNNRPRPGVQNHDMLITTAVTYSIGG